MLLASHSPLTIRSREHLKCGEDYSKEQPTCHLLSPDSASSYSTLLNAIGREPLAVFRNQNNRIVEVRGRPTRIIVRNRAKVMRKDHPCDPSRSTRNSELGRKKKYSAPQFARLSTEEARGMLTARGLPDSPVVRQTLGMGSGTGEAACQEMTGLASVGTE